MYYTQTTTCNCFYYLSYDYMYLNLFKRKHGYGGKGNCTNYGNASPTRNTSITASTLTICF